MDREKFCLKGLINNNIPPIHGIANKGFSGMRSSSPASILVYLDSLISPQSLTSHTIKRYGVSNQPE